MSTLFEAVGHQATKPSGKIGSEGSDLKRFNEILWLLDVFILSETSISLDAGYFNPLKEVRFLVFKDFFN